MAWAWLCQTGALSLLYLLELAAGRAADGAPVRGFAFHGVAADLADVINGRLAGLAGFQVLQGRLEKPVVDLLHLVGEVEAAGGRLVLFLVGPGDEAGVHGGELVALPADGRP